MDVDKVNTQWREAIKAKYELAEEIFQRGGKPTAEDMVAVALYMPHKFDILIQEKK